MSKRTADGGQRPEDFSDLFQSLLDVVEDVVNIFNADREANEVGWHSGSLKLGVAHLPVGVAGGMKHAGAGIGDVGYDVNEFERVHEADGCVAVAFQSEGHDAAGTVGQVFERFLVVGVVR